MDMTVQKDYGSTLQEMKSRLESMKRKQGAAARFKKANKRKKHLKYNAREISGQLLRTTRAVGAGQVLIRAKGKVAQLQRCAATGDYDSKEISAALNHAGRMVRIAKSKVKHLRSEERVEKGTRKMDFRSRMAEQQKEKQMIQMELKKIRRKHRGAEEREIRDAQMRYLRERGASASSGTSGHSGGEGGQGGTAQAATDLSSEMIMEAGADLTGVGMSVDVCL